MQCYFGMGGGVVLHGCGLVLKDFQRRVAWSRSMLSMLAKIAFWSSCGGRRYSRAEKRVYGSWRMGRFFFLRR